MVDQVGPFSGGNPPAPEPSLRHIMREVLLMKFVMVILAVLVLLTIPMLIVANDRLAAGFDTVESSSNRVVARVFENVASLNLASKADVEAVKQAILAELRKGVSAAPTAESSKAEKPVAVALKEDHGPRYYTPASVASVSSEGAGREYRRAAGKKKDTPPSDESSDLQYHPAKRR